MVILRIEERPPIWHRKLDKKASLETTRKRRCRKYLPVIYSNFVSRKAILLSGISKP